MRRDKQYRETFSATLFHQAHQVFPFFPVDGFRLKCRVTNRPYDIFGTWFSDQHLLSGDLSWLAHLVSTSKLWLNKANQEVDSEHTPVRSQVYKFYNRNASSIRAIMVANCPWLAEEEEKKRKAGGNEGGTADGEATGQPGTSADGSSDGSSAANRRAGNPLSHYQMKQEQDSEEEADEDETERGTNDGKRWVLSPSLSVSLKLIADCFDALMRCRR